MDICKGCSNKENEIYECLIRFRDSLIRICPCTTCLVKTMCKSKCEKRKSIFDNLSDSDALGLDSSRIRIKNKIKRR